MAENTNKLNYEYLLAHDAVFRNEAISCFTAVVCKKDKNGVDNKDFPNYIRIEADGKQAIFKSKKVEQGKDKIFINPKILPGIDPTTENVIYKEVSELEYVFYRQRHDKSLRTLWIGLILAIVGAFIDASFAIGKIPKAAVIHMSGSVASFLTWLSMVLKISGLIIVYIKGIREAK